VISWVGDHHLLRIKRIRGSINPMLWYRTVTNGGRWRWVTHPVHCRPAGLRPRRPSWRHLDAARTLQWKATIDRQAREIGYCKECRVARPLHKGELAEVTKPMAGRKARAQAHEQPVVMAGLRQKKQRKVEDDGEPDRSDGEDNNQQRARKSSRHRMVACHFTSTSRPDRCGR
jgi:hypothetical protein